MTFLLFALLTLLAMIVAWKRPAQTISILFGHTIATIAMLLSIWMFKLDLSMETIIAIFIQIGLAAVIMRNVIQKKQTHHTPC